MIPVCAGTVGKKAQAMAQPFESLIGVYLCFYGKGSTTMREPLSSPVVVERTLPEESKFVSR